MYASPRVCMYGETIFTVCDASKAKKIALSRERANVSCVSIRFLTLHAFWFWLLQLLATIKKTEFLKPYLNARFSLSKGDAPHAMKF